MIEKLIQMRGGLSVTWKAGNPTPAFREMCLELDTRKMKVGDGFTPWNDLPYFNDTASVDLSGYQQKNSTTGIVATQDNYSITVNSIKAELNNGIGQSIGVDGTGYVVSDISSFRNKIGLGTGNSPTFASVYSTGNLEAALNGGISVGLSSAGNRGFIATGFSGLNVVTMGSGWKLAWESATVVTTSGIDVNLSRLSPGVLQLGTTASNALGSLKLANLTASGGITVPNDILIGRGSGAPNISFKDYSTAAEACTIRTGTNSYLFGSSSLTCPGSVTTSTINSASGVNIQYNGATELSTSPGYITIPRYLYVGNNGFGNGVQYVSSGWITNAAANKLGIYNNAKTDAPFVAFGGLTASFPGFKRTATAINFRLADDSADAPITASALSSSADLVLSSANANAIYVNTSSNRAGGVFIFTNQADSTFWVRNNSTNGAYHGQNYDFRIRNGNTFSSINAGNYQDLYIGNECGPIYMGSTRVNPGALTGSNAISALEVNQTYNTTGVPALIKGNITWTAAANDTSLLKLQVDGVTRFDVRFPFGKAGPACLFMDSGAGNIQWVENGIWNWRTNGANRVTIGDVGLGITPATLTGSAATSALRITQTYNTTGTPTAFDIDITDTASNAASLLFNGRVGGSSVTSIQKNGLITTGGNYGGGLMVRTGGVVQAILGMHTLVNSNGLHLSDLRPITWSSGQAGTNAVNTSLNCQVGGTVQIGTTINNALGSLACATITTSGIINMGTNRLTAGQVFLQGKGILDMLSGPSGEIGICVNGYLNGTDGSFGGRSFVFYNPAVNASIWSMFIGDAAATVGLRNGTNAQRFNLYGTYATAGADMRRMYFSSTTAGDFRIGCEGLGTGASGNTLILENATSGTSISLINDIVTSFHNGFTGVARDDGFIVSSIRGYSFAASAAANQGTGELRINRFDANTLHIGNRFNTETRDLKLRNLIADGTLTSTIQDLSTDPVMGTDLLANQTRTIRNTSTGVIKSWINDGGTPKSVTYS
jgi:hypothetical protein